MNTEVVIIDAARPAETIEAAVLSLEHEASPVVLDFSSVPRLDATALRALEKLADTARRKAVKVVVRGACVDTYKVLKLMDLTLRFSFETAADTTRE